MLPKHHYSPTVAKGNFLRRIVRDFVQKTLGGSVSPFVAWLADEGEVSEQELADLRRLVKEFEAERKSDHD